jgi:NADH:ubiquinone reductase (non-electrogenic)
VKSDRVLLDDGTVLPCGLVVWSTGLAPQPFVAGLDVQKNRQGQILTDAHLQILSDPSGDSYAIGDCAQIVDVPLPCTAQVYIVVKYYRIVQ